MRSTTHQLKTAKGRPISSTRWLSRQLNDPYVQRAKKEGYRSRAAYKLIEIIEKYQCFHHASYVLDLGCAPGSWMQVLDRQKPKIPHVIGVDLLPVEPFPSSLFIQGDMRDPAIYRQVEEACNGSKLNVLLSDMSPASSGHPSTDHLRSVTLLEECMRHYLPLLAPGGHFICKFLRGSEENACIASLRKHFAHVHRFKPAASRKGSVEFYFICQSYVRPE